MPETFSRPGPSDVEKNEREKGRFATRAGIDVEHGRSRATLCRDAWAARGRGRKKRRREGDGAGWGRMCYRPQSAARRLSVCVGSPSRLFRNTVPVTLRSVFILSFSLSSSLHLSLSPFLPRSLLPPSLPVVRSPLAHPRVPPPSTTPSSAQAGSSRDFLRTRPRFSSSVPVVLRVSCVLSALRR